MSLNDKMLASVQSYFDLFNSGDGKGIADMFADDGVVIDPVGTEPKEGKAAILKFFTFAANGDNSLERTGETRLAGQSAAFPFKVHVKGIKAEDKAVDVDLPTGSMTIDIIDVFDFNTDGKIVQMRAYWGPSNITQ